MLAKYTVTTLGTEMSRTVPVKVAPRLAAALAGVDRRGRPAQAARLAAGWRARSLPLVNSSPRPPRVRRDSMRRIRIMVRGSIVCSVAAVVIGVAAWGPRVSDVGAADREGAPAGAAVPVLVELFTSEGCSSCPPADTLLTRLAAEKTIGGAGIVTLAFHVDYWDRLGWKDWFSSAAFTERQNRYADAWKTDRVYTPQAVVDGRVELVGTDVTGAVEALTASAARPHARVAVALAAGDEPASTRAVRIDVEPPAASRSPPT